MRLGLIADIHEAVEPLRAVVIPIQRINDVYTRMLKGDVKFRFVIDMGSFNR